MKLLNLIFSILVLLTAVVILACKSKGVISVGRQGPSGEKGNPGHTPQKRFMQGRPGKNGKNAPCILSQVGTKIYEVKEDEETKTITFELSKSRSLITAMVNAKIQKTHWTIPNNASLTFKYDIITTGSDNIEIKEQVPEINFSLIKICVQDNKIMINDKYTEYVTSNVKAICIHIILNNCLCLQFEVSNIKLIEY